MGGEGGKSKERKSEPGNWNTMPFIVLSLSLSLSHFSSSSLTSQSCPTFCIGFISSCCSWVFSTSWGLWLLETPEVCFRAAREQFTDLVSHRNPRRGSTVVGLGPSSMVTGLSLSKSEEQKRKDVQTERQPVDRHMVCSTTPTGPSPAVSDKTQGHSKITLHLFFGLGGALINHKWLMYSDFKTFLDFILPPTRFLRNSLFLMLQLMLLRR